MNQTWVRIVQVQNVQAANRPGAKVYAANRQDQVQNAHGVRGVNVYAVNNGPLGAPNNCHDIKQKSKNCQNLNLFGIYVYIALAAGVMNVVKKCKPKTKKYMGV